MKIGILTFNQEVSCGALLQAHALQKKLNECGVTSLQIRRNDTPCKIFIPIKSCRNVLTNINRLVHYRRHSKKMWAHLSFMDKYINYSDRVYHDGEDKLLEKDYDGFVVGSDQVWNCTGGFDDFFFLKNISSKKRKLSYAASIGLKAIDESKKPLYIKYCNDFHWISVREESAQKNLQEILPEKKIYQVIDPVLLYDASYWRTLVGDRLIKEKYIFVYATERSDSFFKCMNIVANDVHCKIVTMPTIKGYDSIEFEMGPIEFLNYIYYSEFVITSSFHATAFSLIFNKPLVAFMHSTTGSRVADLLFSVKAENAIFSDKMRKLPILDYKIINEKLKQQRANAIEYIKMMLE